MTLCNPNTRFVTEKENKDWGRKNKMNIIARRRRRVIGLYKLGHKPKEISKLINVKIRTVHSDIYKHKLSMRALYTISVTTHMLGNKLEPYHEKESDIFLSMDPYYSVYELSVAEKKILKNIEKQNQ